MVPKECNTDCSSLDIAGFDTGNAVLTKYSVNNLLTSTYMDTFPYFMNC